jgi:hypothetical protein
MLRLTLLVVIALPCQVLFLRMDMFPATLTFLAFLAFLHQRYVWAGVFLMLSVGTKLYPIVLIPVFGVVLLVWWNWKAIGKFTLGLLIPLVCILIVWKGILQKEPMGLVSFLSPHSERGIQIESIAASGVYLYSFYKDLDLKVKFSYGADHLVFQYTDAILQVLIGIFVLSKLVLIMMTGVVFRSVPQQTDRQSATLLATYVTAALMLFILANKVFSPQYLVWILPFVCFLKRRIQLGFVAIFTLSSVLFPFLYVEIAKLNMPEQGWLIFRNFLFLLVFAALFFSASYRKKKVA